MGGFGVTPDVGKQVEQVAFHGDYAFGIEVEWKDEAKPVGGHQCHLAPSHEQQATLPP